jgi:glyceraldehyde 3-phosphate dehydrogenase
VHRDPRRARAAAQSIIPTSTGAARVVGLIFPELRGRVDGMALRVPIPDGSITDFVARVGRAASAEEVNAAFRRAAEHEMRDILDYSEAPLVSSDIVGNPASCIFDSQLTMSVGQTVKVLGWYDNEWGFSNRTADLVRYIGERL